MEKYYKRVLPGGFLLGDQVADMNTVKIIPLGKILNFSLTVVYTVTAISFSRIIDRKTMCLQRICLFTNKLLRYVCLGTLT